MFNLNLNLKNIIYLSALKKEYVIPKLLLSRVFSLNGKEILKDL